MRSGRFVAVALLLGAALCPLTAQTAHADVVGVVETPVSLHASLPDDEGNAVTLDGGVDVPVAGCPCPGVIINHGFLGSWTDSGDVAHALASQGYVVLRYSSRGFGKSKGEVDLVGPKETQDLLDAVHWLNDPASPIVGGLVIHNDIGQYGASYGGVHAWALARQNDPAVRTVVPTATWTDAYQALLPNDVLRLAYVNGFYATGLDPVVAAQNGQAGTTDNYSQEVHRWIAEANSGVDVADIKAGLDARSVHGRYDEVHIPVFIVQGTNDGLFSQNQALDAYQALTARRVPARLYVGGIGRPPSNPSTSSAEALHVFAEISAWFDHYLKGVDNGIDRMPPIEYARTKYFGNTWDGTTRSASAYPFGPASSWFLCTTDPHGGTLSPTPCPSAPPAVAVNVPAGSGYDQEPVTHPYIEEAMQQLTGGAGPDVSSAPAVLTYDGPALPQGGALDLAGIPSLSLQVAAADFVPAGARGGAAAFQLDPKLYDVAPDGSAQLVTRGAFAQPLDGTAPGGSTSAQHAVGYDVFGLSYLVPAGHHVRLTLSTSDAPYLRPTANAFAVALFSGSTLALPTAVEMVPTPPPFGPAAAVVPEAPLVPLLPLAVAVAVAAAALGPGRRARREAAATASR